MKVLIIGSGAREHAIAWKFASSKRISGLFIAPGNAGTGKIGINLDNLDPADSDAVIKICREKKISLVFIGPETLLAEGLIDKLTEANIPAFGPHKKAAKLESSKTFSKNFMNRNGIPTADSEEFTEIKPLTEFIEKTDGKIVIKKNGLAAGKGVFESENKNELLNFGKEILKNDSLLAEEFLRGYEISIFALTDKKDYLLLPSCADFKKAGENDTGLNTGGMGAICPVPFVDSKILERVEKEIIGPTFDGMKKEGLSYSGVLYFGIMITEEGPKLLEYNVRFGDPEAQVLLPLINSDFGNLSEAVIHGKLGTFPIKISQKSAIGVVVASSGYPGEYKKRLKVKPIKKEQNGDSVIFHASTVLSEDNTVLTGGGRCFTAVGIGPDFLRANKNAYSVVPGIKFDGAWYRKDIGMKFFIDREKS